jgi:hypothetical protein
VGNGLKIVERTRGIGELGRKTWRRAGLDLICGIMFVMILGFETFTPQGNL